ncbi:MAG: DUF1636 domain-containing protein [Kastovskya adunca ATA6-11-RM4]|jgi:predicted metal-binding protein|nr:DUF1636 domain-containing protein [Kastovskya adunca ATA6-11-RM4]
MTQTTLFVCTTCASTWKDGKPIGVSGGQKLLEQLQHLQQGDNFSIRPVECMSACSHACVVSFAAPGKYTYVFGDLPVNDEALPVTSAAVLQCASQYSAKSDGLLPWSERPEPLKRSLLAKVPPLT